MKEQGGLSDDLEYVKCDRIGSAHSGLDHVRVEPKKLPELGSIRCQVSIYNNSHIH